MHRRRMRIAATALAIGMAMAGAIATNSSAALAQGAPTMDEIERNASIAAYQRVVPSLTTAQAGQWVDGQRDRAALLQRLTTESADTFGGSWFDPKTGIQHLNFTDGPGVRGLRQAATDSGIAVQLHQVDHSLDSLYRLADQIRGEHARSRAVQQGVGVDPIQNRVVVVVPSASTRLTATAAAHPAVVVKVGKLAAMGPEACHSRFNCSAPLRSGVALRQGGQNLCSVGFTARGGDGARFAVTAGHCAGVLGRIWSHNSVDIGPIGDVWNADDIDVARIRMTRAPWVDASGGWMYNEGNPNSPTALEAAVTRYGQIQFGDNVCLQGYNNTAAGACGIILFASDPEGRGFTRVAFDACPGDSGGGWYAPNGGNRTAMGIHHGGPLPPELPRPFKDSWFSPLPAINAFWDRHSATTIRVETR